jgi:hypothetical protein
MNPNEPAKQIKTPAELVNLLFMAVSQYKSDPREVLAEVISFLKEALVFAILSIPDEAAQKSALKQIGEAISSLQPPSKAR